MQAEVVAEPALRARERRAWPADLLKRVGVTLIVLAALWALWEAYRALWFAKRQVRFVLAGQRQG